MHQKKLSAGARDSSLADRFTPVVLAQLRLPHFAVQLIHVRVSAIRLVEQRVLDEVHRKKRGPPRIEGLEDDLCVVSGLQIDRDDLEKTGERDTQRLVP